MTAALIVALLALAAACFWGVNRSEQCEVLTIQRDRAELIGENQHDEIARLRRALYAEIVRNGEHVAAIELLANELDRRDAKSKPLRALKAAQ